MERIKKAVELAKANRSKLLGQPNIGPPLRQPQDASVAPVNQPASQVRATRGFDSGVPVKLNKWHLHSNRIVSDDGADPRGRSFEMLRTHLIQRMQELNHHTVGVTSPTPGCGKTVCAINLAFTIARLPEKSVTLIDMDLRKPQIASYLGLKEGLGVEHILRGEAKLSEVALIPAGLNGRLRILPTFRTSREAAELMTSNKMRELVQYLRAQDPGGVIVFDLPPLLVVDDVLSFMPNIDGLLLIAASGQTTNNDLVNSERIVGPDKILGVVLNKSEENVVTNTYY